jgi:polysaccharide export outer membrane protein
MPMKQIFYAFVVVLLFSACSTKKYQKIVYFNDLKDSVAVSQQIANYNVLKIQKDDILAISVSSLNIDASAIFNQGNTISANTNLGTNSNGASGFIVDQQGNVQLPYLGSVKVEGLSTAAAREIIQKKLNEGEYLKNAVVSLRLANFKISVFGDVAKPGIYPIQNERVTVLDAISMAGDLTITGMRDNVLLIRESEGKREQIRLNLQSKDLMSSPYYYLKTNDAIYVQPGPAKFASVDSNYRNASLLLSAISVIALIISRL